MHKQSTWGIKSGHYYDIAHIEKIIIGYMKTLTPIHLKINKKCIYSWKNIQIPSHEEIRIVNFTLTSKTTTIKNLFIQNSLGSDDFTSKFYKCSREKYF